MTTILKYRSVCEWFEKGRNGIITKDKEFDNAEALEKWVESVEDKWWWKGIVSVTTCGFVNT